MKTLLKLNLRSFGFFRLSPAMKQTSFASEGFLADICWGVLCAAGVREVAKEATVS